MTGGRQAYRPTIFTSRHVVFSIPSSRRSANRQPGFEPRSHSAEPLNEHWEGSPPHAQPLRRVHDRQSVRASSAAAVATMMMMVTRSIMIVYPNPSRRPPWYTSSAIM
jgi:hypothetical protein